MLRDCKTGGDNFELSHAEGQKLIALILLITIAYTWAVKTGRNCRNIGLQKYVDPQQKLKRISRRHSAFWLGLYGCLWVGAMEFWHKLAFDLMRLKPEKLPYFQQGLRAMTLIQSAL